MTKAATGAETRPGGADGRREHADALADPVGVPTMATTEEGAMSLFGGAAVAVFAVAALAVVVTILLLVMRRGRQDWGGPPRPPSTQDPGRAPYGGDAPTYPAAPPPVAPSSAAEVDVPGGPAPSGPTPPPRRIDDTEVVREQHRLEHPDPDRPDADHPEGGPSDDSRA